MSYNKGAKKQLTSLGMIRFDTGDYDYFDPDEKKKSKHESTNVKNGEPK